VTEPEVIEGEVVDVTDLQPDVLHHEPIPENRAVVIAQPGQVIVTDANDPGAMVAQATKLANALKDIVERQSLYTVINGKKYPEVEAWATIGRLDNVVAREARPPERQEDGSYEAYVDLVRLSDGMVVGSASAICGMPDDAPWNKRAEFNRRSMAVTRATSRAFRQQYAWIMALAGYQATPADEMPRQDAPSASGKAQGRSKAPASTTADPPTADGQPGRFVGVVNEVPDGIRRLADGRPLLELRFKVDGKQHTAKIAGPVAQEMFDAPVSADDEVAIEGTLALIKWSDDPKKPLKKEVHDVTKAAVKVGGKWHVFGGGASADPPTSGTDSPSESTSGSTSSAASTPTPPTGEPRTSSETPSTPPGPPADALDEYPDMRAEAQRIFDPERKQGTPGEKVDAQGTVYNIEWQTAPKTGTRFVLLELTNEDDGLLYRFGYGGTLQELVLTKDGKGFRYHPGDELRCMGTWAKGAFIVASGLMRA
jgi:hypothetical protein